MEVMYSPASSTKSTPENSPLSAHFLGSFADSQTLVDAELGEPRGRPPKFKYRKFGSLRNLTLLYYQDELVKLEDQLASVDTCTAIAVDPTNSAYNRREDAGPERQRLLLQECSDKLAHYDDTLRLALAQDADYTSFGHFLAISLEKLSKAVLGTRQQTGHRTLYSTKRFDLLVRSIIVILAIFLVLTPIHILWELQSTSPAKRAQTLQLLCTLLFTMTFYAYWSIVTKAQRQEVLGATAAYCAVLLVVLSNSSAMPS